MRGSQHDMAGRGALAGLGMGLASGLVGSALTWLSTQLFTDGHMSMAPLLVSCGGVFGLGLAALAPARGGRGYVLPLALFVTMPLTYLGAIFLAIAVHQPQLAAGQGAGDMILPGLLGGLVGGLGLGVVLSLARRLRPWPRGVALLSAAGAFAGAVALPVSDLLQTEFLGVLVLHMSWQGVVAALVGWLYRR